RVGTNIYAAPEHNPLVQTGSLDLEAIAAGHDHLTPAADIYSLAKTTYALLAGESPRRFAQHSIKEMPAVVTSHFWSAPVLQVLEKATQVRPENRYQTVQEFWDDLADAALPPTRSLAGSAVDTQAELRKRPSLDLSVEPVDITDAPPEPQFQPVNAPSQPLSNQTATSMPYADQAAQRRPKIVVPVSTMRAKPGPTARREDALPGQAARDRIAALPDQARNGKVPVARLEHKRRPVGPRRARPYLVAAVLIFGFVGMLLATHKYVTSHWNPLVGLPLLSDVFVIGREGVTTTDVNLRSDASVANAPIGLAEAGSRIKILSTGDNWYEVQVLQHGRPKTDPFTSDKGWVNKKFVKFD